MNSSSSVPEMGYCLFMAISVCSLACFSCSYNNFNDILFVATHTISLASQKQCTLFLISIMWLLHFYTQNFVIWSIITFISFLSIDAYSTKRQGRFANDGYGSGANAYMKHTHTKGNPHLCLFATKHVKSGTEIRYDYNRRSAPWRVGFFIAICAIYVDLLLHFILCSSFSWLYPLL